MCGDKGVTRTTSYNAFVFGAHNSLRLLQVYPHGREGDSDTGGGGVCCRYQVLQVTDRLGGRDGDQGKTGVCGLILVAAVGEGAKVWSGEERVFNNGDDLVGKDLALWRKLDGLLRLEKVFKILEVSASVGHD